jgi:hypothetical protein
VDDNDSDEDIESYWQVFPDDIDDKDDVLDFVNNADITLHTKVKTEETRWRQVLYNTNKRVCGTLKSTYYRKDGRKKNENISN